MTSNITEDTPPEPSSTKFEHSSKNGVFHSLVALQAAIKTFIESHNGKPKPFVWKADPKTIIAAVKRGHQVLETNH